MSNQTLSSLPVSSSLPDSTISDSPDTVLTRRIRLAGRLLALSLCILHAYVNRHQINPDGIAYLEVASTWAEGDWRDAINGYWSPLYSWLLAGAMTLVQPTPYWECATAHLVNVLAFLLALGAFEWLLSEILASRLRMRQAAQSSWNDPLPDWLIVGIGFALFAFVCRRLVTVSLLTPDMLVLAGLCASVALLLRRRRAKSEPVNRLLSVLLGGVLGLSYLAKAVMFPLALVFIGLVLLAGPWRAGVFRSAPHWRRNLLHAGLAFLCFALVGGPWILTLSWMHGRFTVGETGRLNYLWYVNGMARPEQLAAQDLPQTDAGPRQLCREPLLVDCSHPRGRWYPLWYDPSVYYEGIQPSFDLHRQLAASARVAATYASLCGEKALPFTLAVVLLTGFSLFSRRGTIRRWLWQWLSGLAGQAPILVPAVLGLALYLLVGHAEGRLVGPFVLLVALGCLCAIQLPHPRQIAVRAVGAPLLLFLGLLLGGNLLFDAGNALRSFRRGEGGIAHPHWQVAQELRKLRVQHGDKVASLGITYNAYWARLGSLCCVAEVPFESARRFWMTHPRQQRLILTACGLAGARAIVSDCAPPDTPGWQRIGGTNYAIRLLDSSIAARQATPIGLLYLCESCTVLRRR